MSFPRLRATHREGLWAEAVGQAAVLGQQLPKQQRYVYMKVHASRKTRSPKFWAIQGGFHGGLGFNPAASVHDGSIDDMTKNER